MKTIILILALFLIIPFSTFSQENNLQRFKGSWMGRITTIDFLIKGHQDNRNGNFTGTTASLWAVYLFSEID